MCFPRELFALFLIVACSIGVGAEIPTSLDPISYVLNFTALGDRTYEGHVVINGAAAVDSQDICLHSSGLSIKNVTVEGTKYSVTLFNYDYFQDNGTLVLRTSMYRKGDPMTINVQFSGYIDDYFEGFYRSNHNPSKTWVDATQFEAIFARKVFPCFDLPKFRSHFELNFIVNRTKDVISNMPVKSITVNSMKGTKTVSFQQTPRMPTYLLAWIIYDGSNFGLLETSANTTNASVWGRLSLRNQTIAKIILQNVTTVLDSLRLFTGIAYPLAKLDLVALPNFDSVAMENWGLVNFRESILASSSRSSSMEYLSLFLVVSHELSHQWFGDLVSPYSWSYTWLNEGFAKYFEYLNYGLDQFLVVNEIQQIMRLDGPDAHPLTKEGLNSEEDVSEMFDKISYSKGAAILRMLRNLMGADSFRNGMSNYLRNASTGSIVPGSEDSSVKFSNVTYPDLLWRALTEATPSNVLSTFPSGVEHFGTIMTSWSNTSSYPLVRIVKTGNNSYEMDQIPQGSNDTSFSWWIPVTILNEASSHQSLFFWLRPNDEPVKFNIPGRWYYVNPNSTGFYRVIYDDDNWKTLSEVLKRKPCPLPPLARSQILTDALELMISGHLSPKMALDVVEFLRGEDSDIVWTSAFNGLSAISEDMISSDNWEIWKKYVNDLITNVSDASVYETTKNSGISVVQLFQGIHATNVVKNACFYGNSTCVEKANELKTNYNSPKLTIRDRELYLGQEVEDFFHGNLRLPTFNPNLQRALLCTAMKNVTLTEWLSLYRRYKVTTPPTEKQAILENLCCAEDPDILKRLLDSLLSGESIQDDNFKTVIYSICSNPIGARVVFAWLKDNYANITGRLNYNGNDEAKIVKSIACKLTTVEEIDEVEEFLRSVGTNIRPDKKVKIVSQARQIIEKRKATEKQICSVLTCKNGAGFAVAVSWRSSVLTMFLSITFFLY